MSVCVIMILIQTADLFAKTDWGTHTHTIMQGNVNILRCLPAMAETTGLKYLPIRQVKKKNCLVLFHFRVGME